MNASLLEVFHYLEGDRHQSCLKPPAVLAVDFMSKNVDSCCCGARVLFHLQY